MSNTSRDFLEAIILTGLQFAEYILPMNFEDLTLEDFDKIEDFHRSFRVAFQQIKDDNLAELTDEKLVEFINNLDTFLP